MPLLDHFHPPLADLPPWSSVATTWAVSLMRWLNRTLPAGEFIAYPTIHLGAQVEADVAEYDKRTNGGAAMATGGVATLLQIPLPWVHSSPSSPTNRSPRGHLRHELNLCEVIELVSGNKKRS